MLTIYGDARSGNCLKVRWTAELLSIPHSWVEVLALTGAAQTPAFLALNPAGQVPVVTLADGRPLAQSNAIVLHLAEGSSLIPADAYDRAKALEWMFWEQYSHEPVIAVRRADVAFRGKTEAEIDPSLLPRGRKLLGVMEGWLKDRPWFSGPSFGVADIALVAYTRVAHEGGFTLAETPAVQRWVRACEAELGIPAA
jgi:glutathione S-transferase